MTQALTSPFLEFENVSIAYGRRQAVSGCSLSIERGVTFGLMGLNGAGKTTLIKALLGLRDMRTGRIILEGRDSRLPSARRILAYLPERFDPPWFLKGREFIRFSMELYGVPFDERAMEETATRLKLDPAVLANRMSTYSKGMRQKAGLMATVLTGCPLLILDEPMSGLDPAARAAVKDVILQMQHEGRTIFFSSHILGDMDEICGHIAVIHQGRKIFDGTPERLKAQEKSPSLEQAFLKAIDSSGYGREAA